MTSTLTDALSGADIVALTKAHTIFEWSAQSKVDPIPVAGAEGCWFWTPEGKRYLDFNSQLMCVNIGHGDRRVIKAIQEQAATLAYANPFMATEPRALLGQKLAAITPGDIDAFFFTNGGAEANENAIKIARMYTGRHKILARYRSYHGATGGAMTLTGDPRRWAAEPGLPGIVHVADAYHGVQRGWDEVGLALANIEEVIQFEGPQHIAAFFIEPVTGTNGILVPPDGYLQGIRELCTRYGILMVADEVMSGFGRTGEWFAVDHWKIVPDLMTMAKGLTSAYVPLGAVGMRSDDRGPLQGQGVLRRPDVQQSPARVRDSACDARGVRGGQPHRAGASDGRPDVHAVEGPGSQTRDRRRDAVDRAVRDRRAGEGQADHGAARAVQRHVRTDGAAGEVLPRTGTLHVRPVEHVLRQPAADDHRGRAPPRVRHLRSRTHKDW